MKYPSLLVGSLLALAAPITASQVPTPAPAVFGTRMLIDDSQFPGKEYESEFQTPWPRAATPEYSPVAGGIVSLDSESNIARTGAPFTRAELQADYDGTHGVTGQAAASLSYQVVIIGGTPGALTPVNFGTFGELSSATACRACPDLWLSASASLRVRNSQTGQDYFLLGDTTSTVFQWGSRNTPIAHFVTLMLPIDQPLDVSIGVAAYGYTQEAWQGQTIGSIRSFAFLDPTFTPQDPGISVLQSSNLVPVPEASRLASTVAGLLAVASFAARRRRLPR